MEKIDGVTDVKVSLNEGTVVLRLAPTNRVTIERIREEIRSNGFAPRQAEVRITGQVMARGDSLVLVVAETNETFVLEDAPNARGRRAEIGRTRLGTKTVISGEVPASGKQPTWRPRRLLVRSFAASARPG